MILFITCQICCLYYSPRECDLYVIILSLLVLVYVGQNMTSMWVDPLIELKVLDDFWSCNCDFISCLWSSVCIQTPYPNVCTLQIFCVHLAKEYAML